MKPGLYLKFLSPRFRRKIPLMILLGVVRRLLDLVGLAALLPVIALIIYPVGIEGDSLMAGLFRLTGLETLTGFGVALGVFALVLLPVKSVFTIWMNNINNSYLLSIYRDCSRQLYRYHHDRGVLFIRRAHSSQLAFHINGACWGYANNIVGTIIGGAADIVIALLLASLAVWLAPGAALMVLGTMIPVVALWFVVVKTRLEKLGARAYEARRRQSRIVQESLKGHVSMNVNDSFDAVTREFEQGLDDISAADLKNSIYRQIPSLIVQICAAVTLVVLLVTGTAGKASVEMFLLFGFAAVRLMPLVLSLASGWNTLQNSRYIADIIEEAVGFHGEEHEDIPPMSFEHRIEMRNVTFAFEGEEPVLSDVSLGFAKGASVGIRGESGAGKSTLFNLLLGFYVPQAGGVYIDGVRLSAATRKSWHRIVGYVEQEVFIKNDTLANNIAPPTLRPDRARIREVLGQVGLGAWAEGLPEGIDTVIGESGSSVSGGEKQRIGIARALYKHPQVLFVDEATSALDAESEREIVSLLHSLARRGLTLLIISHRQSTLRLCDRVIEM